MNWKDKNKQQLITSLLELQTRDEAQRFLRDLMTESEIEEFSKRFEAAQLLTQNVPYSQIIIKTGLSSTTVARVSKWLKGDLEGYKTIINRLHHHTNPQSGSGMS